MSNATILVVPGLRDETPDHWQSLLAAEVPGARAVPALGRANLDCGARVDAIARAVEECDGPIILVAHSGGVISVAHWVARGGSTKVKSALLAAPADLETELPTGYPAIDALRANGWLPIPRMKLPFPSIVGASGNDPLAKYGRVSEFAHDWGSLLLDLGDVGHLNPASGFGRWPLAQELIGILMEYA